MNTDSSRKLYEKASRLMPGGVSSPVRAFRAVGGDPLYIREGKGARMTDEDGNEFIDYCMSWGPLILGHADQSVINAIRRTARLGTSFGTSNRYEVQLAQMIKKRFESIEMLRFVNSGTEAVMSAIRLARGFRKRDKIVKCDGCYHGHVDQLLVAAGSGLATLGTPDSAGVTKSAAQDTIVVPFNDINAIEKLFSREHDTIAAIIMEPVPCNYGLILPVPDYLHRIRDLCDRYGILLILDEVITGFRLAPGGAQEYYDIRADITTMGKIIGGGLPVGAYGGSKKIMKYVSPMGAVYQAGTLSGNPLAMIAGIQTLKKMHKINGYEILREKTEQLHMKLKPSLDRHRGRVLFSRLESIFAFNFTDGSSIESLDDIKKCDMKLFARFHGEMLRRGIYLSPSGYEVGFMSAAHTDQDIDMTAAAAAGSLDAVLG